MSQRAGKSLSSTTRKPRPGEKNGRHYNFYSLEEFKRREARGEFLETAQVHGNWYGTRKEDLDRALSIYEVIVLVIDIQGVKKVKEFYPSARIVCISATLDEVRGRLLSRDGNSGDDIERRMETARNELAEMGSMQFDLIIENHDGMYGQSALALYRFISKVCREQNRPQ